MLRTIAIAVMVALPSAASAQSLVTLASTDVAAMIDATSFPNSIGPRREDGLKTFGDYGFTEVELNGETVELYDPDRSWMFGITVLEADDDRLIVCILDRALGGPTYHAQHAYPFARGTDALLIAAGEPIDTPKCPTRP